MERKKRIYCTLGGFLTGVLTTCLIWAYVGRIPAGHTGDVRADDSADRPGQASDMSVLPESSASPGENTGSSVPQSPVDTWDSAAVYTGGDTVSYQGRRYRAKWWTQGEKPDSSDVWKDLGILDGKAIQPEGIKNIPIDASEPKDTALTDFKVVGYYPSWKPDKLQSVDFGILSSVLLSGDGGFI